MGMVIGFKHYEEYLKRVCYLCGAKINMFKGEFDDIHGIWFCDDCRKKIKEFCDNCGRPVLDQYFILKNEEGLTKQIYCKDCISIID